MPSYRMSGLTDEQLDDLVARVEDFFEEPWDKETGRPKALSLRDALIVTCGYMRNNITEEVWGVHSRLCPEREGGADVALF